MSLWHRIFYLLRLRQDPGSRYYLLDEPLNAALLSVAEQNGCRPEDLAADLLSSGLAQQYSSNDAIQRWQSLSPREQDVSALACLGYTNQQIAVRLGISPETVKTHLHNALVKFNLHSRSELRLLLSAWDFSAWEHQ